MTISDLKHQSVETILADETGVAVIDQRLYLMQLLGVFNTVVEMAIYSRKYSILFKE